MGYRHHRRRRPSGALPALGAILLAIARADLAAPTIAPCARVDAMLASVGLAPGASWGPAAISLWVAEACAHLGWSQPPVHAPDAATLIEQLQVHGRWRDRLASDAVRPGMLCGAEVSGRRFVGVVDHVADGLIYVIEGEAGSGGHNRVAVRTRLPWMPSYLGVGLV